MTTQAASRRHAALSPAALERRRVERAWARSEADLARALRKLERTVTRSVSPRRIVRERLGWWLLGAFVIGAGFGWKRDEER